LKRVYPEQPVVGVGAIIVKDRKIALIKRGNEPSKGKWTVPGGLVELAESPEQAVIRETKEEVGLDVEGPILIDVVSNVDYDEAGKVKYDYIIIDYFVHVKRGVDAQAASDAQELRWVPLEDVEKMELTPSFRRFFRHNRQKLEVASSYP
jgi:8-oxo-dGTP diphosphatase